MCTTAIHPLEMARWVNFAVFGAIWSMSALTPRSTKPASRQNGGKGQERHFCTAEKLAPISFLSAPSRARLASLVLRWDRSVRLQFLLLQLGRRTTQDTSAAAAGSSVLPCAGRAGRIAAVILEAARRVLQIEADAVREQIARIGARFPARRRHDRRLPRPDLRDGTRKVRADRPENRRDLRVHRDARLFPPRRGGRARRPGDAGRGRRRPRAVPLRARRPRSCACSSSRVPGPSERSPSPASRALPSRGRPT